MAIKTRYRIRNAYGEYDVVHFQTSADQVVTSEDLQFVTKEEKQKIKQSEIYTHIQIASSSTWNIEHNLGKFPSVTVIDSAGSLVIGDVCYLDENNIRIEFSSGFSGKALLN